MTREFILRGGWLQAHWTPIALSSAIGASWLWLNRPALLWFGQAFQEFSIWHSLILLAGSLLLLSIGFKSRSVFTQPEMRFAPGLLLLGCGLSAIGLRWLIDFEQLPVLLFVLGSYGALGLVLKPIVWRRGLVMAVALSCLLPFGVQFSTGLGFPARVLTAHLVEGLLQSWQIGAVSSEDIIVLDAGIAQVDLPCSGLKSLWTGTLFLIAATWLERRAIGLRWLLVCLANFGILIAANVARILTLVLLTQVWHQAPIGSIVHVPLGIASFVTACALSWGLLRWVPHTTTLEPSIGQPPRSSAARLARSKPALTLVAIGLALLALVPLPPAPLPPSARLSEINWSPLHTEPIALTEFEQEFFTHYPGVIAQKQRFATETRSGSILLVSSSTWRSQHAPELCYISGGFHVDGIQTRAFAPGFSGRWLSLNHGSQSAVYWFQAGDRTTDDFLSRVWAEMSRQTATWTMVSILFDQAVDPAINPVINPAIGSANPNIQPNIQPELKAAEPSDTVPHFLEQVRDRIAAGYQATTIAPALSTAYSARPQQPGPERSGPA